MELRVVEFVSALSSFNTFGIGGSVVIGESKYDTFVFLSLILTVKDNIDGVVRISAFNAMLQTLSHLLIVLCHELNLLFVTPDIILSIGVSAIEMLSTETLDLIGNARSGVDVKVNVLLHGLEVSVPMGVDRITSDNLRTICRLLSSVCIKLASFVTLRGNVGPVVVGAVFCLQVGHDRISGGDVGGVGISIHERESLLVVGVDLVSILDLHWVQVGHDTHAVPQAVDSYAMTELLVARRSSFDGQLEVTMELVDVSGLSVVGVNIKSVLIIVDEVGRDGICTIGAIVVAFGKGDG